MENHKLAHIHFVSRFSLAFVFIYHGLVPKIIWLSPIEVNLTNIHNFGFSATLISPIAGIMEILLGLAVFLLTKILMPVYIAIFILFVLLIDVMLFMPELLIEAFNPVTLNLVSMTIGYLIIITQQDSSLKMESLK